MCTLQNVDLGMYFLDYSIPTPVTCNFRDGLLKAVGPVDAIDARYKGASFDTVIDASGMVVIPGRYPDTQKLGNSWGWMH